MADGKWDKARTWPPNRDQRVGGALCLDVLERHFRGKDCGHVIGLHTTSANNTGRWLAFDMDAHDGATDGSANLQDALTLSAWLKGEGYAALLEDSDGGNGIHVWILFDEPAPTERIHALGQQALAECRLTCELFPKQPQLVPGKYGNWLRLPGRHHTRSHFSRTWNDGAWRSGADAVAAILGAPVNPTTDLPPYERPMTGRKKTTKRQTAATASGKTASSRDRDIAICCLAQLKPERAENYDEWLRVGMALHSAGDDLLPLWETWSAKSSKYMDGDCAAKWSTFTPSGVTLGSLVHWARGDSRVTPIQPLDCPFAWVDPSWFIDPTNYSLPDATEAA
jgi:hypothetical protein